MAIELNHTIINVTNKETSANFISEILGLPEPIPFLQYFLVVHLSNGISLDFCNSPEKIEPQHYAFLVSDDEFDQIYKKIKDRNISHWADPAKNIPNKVNTHFGGRGLYFEEPSGHFLEIITRPYDYLAKNFEMLKKGLK